MDEDYRYVHSILYTCLVYTCHVQYGAYGVTINK